MTNGTKGTHRTRTMLTLADCDGDVGEDHETGDDLQLERVELFMPLLDGRTHVSVGRAAVQVALAWRTFRASAVGENS